jgi:molybdenum cofactor biosynthesis enzyme
MEALTGLNIALLTIWDLVKPVNAALEITSVRLLYKSGGKSGAWTHPDGLPAGVDELILEFGG